MKHEEAEQVDFTEEEAEQEFKRLQDRSQSVFCYYYRPNVGKSTLTNRILGEERVVVYDMPGTTLWTLSTSQWAVMSVESLPLIDTVGVRRRKNTNETAEVLGC